MGSNELAHYGVLGMKWGVRRTPEQLARSRDQKTRRTLTRHLAADKKHIKQQGRSLNDAHEEYQDASKVYKKALSRPSLSRVKKDQRIREASENLTNAGTKYARKKADLDRANRIYND